MDPIGGEHEHSVSSDTEGWGNFHTELPDSLHTAGVIFFYFLVLYFLKPVLLYFLL